MKIEFKKAARQNEIEEITHLENFDVICEHPKQTISHSIQYTSSSVN